MRHGLKLLAMGVAAVVIAVPLSWIGILLFFTVGPVWLIWSHARGLTPEEEERSRQEAEAAERAVQAFLRDNRLMDTPENRGKILTAKRKRRVR